MAWMYSRPRPITQYLGGAGALVAAFVQFTVAFALGVLEDRAGLLAGLFTAAVFGPISLILIGWFTIPVAMIVSTLYGRWIGRWLFPNMFQPSPSR